MKYLIQSSECYRVETKEEVDKLIAEAKEETSSSLAKYSCVYREKKAKGEVIDSWYKVTLVKNFNDEKDPTSYIEVTYEV